MPGGLDNFTVIWNYSIHPLLEDLLKSEPSISVLKNFTMWVLKLSFQTSEVFWI